VPSQCAIIETVQCYVRQGRIFSGSAAAQMPGPAGAQDRETVAGCIQQSVRSIQQSAENIQQSEENIQQCAENIQQSVQYIQNSEELIQVSAGCGQTSVECNPQCTGYIQQSGSC